MFQAQAAAHFASIISFKPPNNPMRQRLFLRLREGKRSHTVLSGKSWDLNSELFGYDSLETCLIP